MEKEIFDSTCEGSINWIDKILGDDKYHNFMAVYNGEKTKYYLDGKLVKKIDIPVKIKITTNIKGQDERRKTRPF